MSKITKKTSQQYRIAKIPKFENGKLYERIREEKNI